MTKQKNTLLIGFILCSFIQFSFAQLDIKIGQWKSYLPYQKGLHVTQSESTVYYTTEFSLVAMDKDELAPERLSKVEGLSEAGMGVIKYDPFNQLVIVTYFNGNIDFVKEDGSILNLPFVFTSDIVGDKEIVDIYTHSAERTYFAMGFGLKVLNVKDEEFGDETRAGIRFNSVIVHNEFIYASTDEGIYRVKEDGSTNIQDFSLWERLDDSFGFPADYSSKAVASYKGNLYVNVDDALYIWNEGSLEFVYEEENRKIDFLTTEGNHLLVGALCFNPDNDNRECDAKVLFYNESGLVGIDGSDCVNRLNYAIEDNQGRVFYADRWNNYRLADKHGETCNKFALNSPFSHFIGDLVIDEDNIWVGTETGSFSSVGLISLVENDWTVYNNQSNPELDGNRAFYRLAIHPENKKVYIGTRWDGLLEFDPATGEFTTFNEINSTLDFSADPSRIRVYGLAFDQENNLWLANHTATNQKPITVLTNEGEFINDFKSFSSKDVEQIVIDQNNYIWIATSESGLFVYDYNGTINNKDDDRIRKITSSNSELPDNHVNCLALDLDGNVWAGTNFGAVVFECQASIFEDNCIGSIPKVDVNGILGLLLSTERVETIAIDGANRKWFGTSNGVFVQSPNGKTQIAQFDTENSPLFDNSITDIAINNKTGEVFIGTGKGLISLRTDATEGGRSHSKSNIYAFPNPVRPDYEGPIAIKGFAKDSNIKITDLSGQLVYETKALGGQAIWDGRDYNGRKASSGVYLVLATRTSNRDTPEAIVTKILFIN